VRSGVKSLAPSSTSAIIWPPSQIPLPGLVPSEGRPFRLRRRGSYCGNVGPHEWTRTANNHGFVANGPGIARASGTRERISRSSGVGARRKVRRASTKGSQFRIHNLAFCRAMVDSDAATVQQPFAIPGCRIGSFRPVVWSRSEGSTSRLECSHTACNRKADRRGPPRPFYSRPRLALNCYRQCRPIDSSNAVIGAEDS
jgi:hypothetical protein